MAISGPLKWSHNPQHPHLAWLRSPPIFKSLLEVQLVLIWAWPQSYYTCEYYSALTSDQFRICPVQLSVCSRCPSATTAHLGLFRPHRHPSCSLLGHTAAHTLSPWTSSTKTSSRSVRPIVTDSSSCLYDHTIFQKTTFFLTPPTDIVRDWTWAGPERLLVFFITRQRHDDQHTHSGTGVRHCRRLLSTLQKTPPPTSLREPQVLGP